MRPEERARLDEAYRRTTYRVGKLALRIGELHPALDALLAGREIQDYAYLTAVNPRSQPLAEEENRRRMRALTQRLHQEGWTYLVGEAIPETAEWPHEPSVLVLGMSTRDAEALGRELEQNAIVVGERGGVPRLVWLR